MIRTRVFLIIIVLVLVVIGSAHLRSTQASCVTIPGTSIICNNDNDPVNVTATTLTQVVDGGGGNDTIVIDSLSRVGNNSADTNHGVVGGTGQDSIINSGVVRGSVGIRDGDGLSTLPDIDEDYIENYGTIVSQDTGIMGGGGDLLINYNSIQANFGISCFFAAGSGCSIANYGRISAPSMAIQGSSLNDEVLNTSLIGNVGLYSGNDTLINLGSGRITGYVETGTGSDSVLNFATIDGVSGVNLGADADILINQGSTLYAANIASSVFGGNGNDTIINRNYGYIDGIDGGDGDDSLFNSSIVAGVMMGGIGNDTVTVAPGGRANYIGGDDGNDSVSNQGFVNTTLQGGIGNDTVTNFAGATASWLDGFNGDDRVLNGGFVNADLTGGAGNDSVVNLAGAFVSQIYGNAGSDTVVNGGFLNGSAWGGSENDIVVNLGGAQATNLYGEDGSDSVFNGGYLVGTLFGGVGNDTLVNAAFAFAQHADLGDGDDRFTNGGWLNSTLQCGAGNDTVSIGGRIEGGIACGDGNDLVYILNGVVAGQGAAIIGTINGGPGIDGLGFAFTVNVPSLAAANAISAAIAAASPAGGTITIGLLTYTWTNFEALYNLLSFNIAEDVIITIPVVRRVNQHDAAAPVAIYCAAGGVELWTVDAGGAGRFAASIPHTDVNAGTTVSANGVTFVSTAGGAFTVTATGHDGKPYAFTGGCS